MEKLFSVVIPIYKVEEYLEETIESVINQTIGFKDNIELILVNDGSPDNSEEICLKYKELYPDNVIYIKQKNAGVSAARNNGLEHATGKYVNFLDSDDKWELDVFKKVYMMFENNDDVDVIGVRQKFFEKFDWYPGLDYKFKSDKVVDLTKDYNYIQLSVTSGFIRRSAIGDIRFDTTVKFSEDAKFIAEIIVKNMRLGIISSSLHLYRKRYSENSAIQVKNYKNDWYIDTVKKCYTYLFEYSKKMYGCVIPYIQYYVAYDYHWRLTEAIPEEISDDVVKDYLNMTKSLFKQVDDEVIIDMRDTPFNVKLNMFKLKYGNDIKKILNIYEEKGYDIKKIISKRMVDARVTKLDNNNLIIKGWINDFLLLDKMNIYLFVNGKKEKVKLKEKENSNIYNFIGQITKRSYEFEINVPIDDSKKNEISLAYEYIDGTYIKLVFNFKLNTFLSTYKSGFYTNKKFIVYKKRNSIIVEKYNYFKNLTKRFKFNLVILKKLKFKVFVYRLLARIHKIFNRKPIWIVSDRTIVANDNGMHLFKYLCEHEKEAKVYFTISKKSKDYNEMKKIGRVVPYNSLYYKILFLNSKMLISSQADEWVTNAFNKSENFYRDFNDHKFVFLQHGITKDDLSDWLNIFTKDIRLFITSSPLEYNSIVNNKKYGYDESVVKLTGLPRFDNLKDKSKKIIAIMPTWRVNYSGRINKLTGMRDYNTEFNKSDYFKFYNDLINDKRLLKEMKAKGYEGIFVLHPMHEKNSKDFKENECFSIPKGFADYQKIFNESSLLISDYSSVVFDFCYMYKPIIYTQFDKDAFYENAVYSDGYFDYEKNGFGPVCYDYEKTVNTIIKYIDSDCKMENKYKKNIDKFYKFHDQKNCERVYNEIKNIK